MKSIIKKKILHLYILRTLRTIQRILLNKREKERGRRERGERKKKKKKKLITIKKLVNFKLLRCVLGKRKGGMRYKDGENDIIEL
jgi:hypothetical protein